MSWEDFDNDPHSFAIYDVPDRYEAEMKAQGGTGANQHTVQSGNDSQEPCHLPKTADAPPTPFWWKGEGAHPVRCADCIHPPTRPRYCTTAHKRVGAPHLWRRCKSFESRITPPLEPPPPRTEKPVEPSAPTPAPIERPHPAIRLRAVLERHNLTHRVSEIEPLPENRVGVRLARNLSDEQAFEMAGLIEQVLVEGIA